MRWLTGLLICFFVLVLAEPSWADKRVALVIGNSAYKSVPRLANPARDAEAIAGLFKAAKFDVVEVRNDLDFVSFRRLLRDFFDKSRDASMAVVYYAGHGIEVEGSNYLIPVDAVLERDRDAQDEAVSLERVLQTIEPAMNLRLVILDACRDNPFARTMKRTIATRSLDRGFASVEPNKSNTLIAFAAKAGSTAEDGTGEHSPFATSLLKHLTVPGLDLRKALGMVRDEVMRETGGKQEPFVYGSLGGGDVSLVPALPVPQAATSGAGEPQDLARREYEMAERVGTNEVWNSFLSRHPKGFFADLARGQLRKIGAEEQRLAAVDQAKRAADERARLAAEGASRKEQEQAAARAKAADAERVRAEQRKKAEEAKLAKAETAKAKEPVAERKTAEQPQRGGRTCTSTHAECIKMATPFGQSWVNNCSKLKQSCMATGEWRSGLRSYSNVVRR